MIPLRLEKRLLFVSVLLEFEGKTLVCPRVMLDTGSVATVFRTEYVQQIGLEPHLTDRIRVMRGIGGIETVIEKSVDRITVGDWSMYQFPIQLGLMDYDSTLDGILGLDFLLASKTVIDLNRMVLSR
ncbi:MAG: retropepsin-like aspartic protease [Phototrophicaceae bacterium]